MHVFLADPLSRLLAQLVVIVLASRLLGVAMRRIGQPQVIAEVVAGIMLGPSLLGWVAPSVFTALFSKPSLPILHITSQLGLILFMFVIGLELDAGLLRGRGRAALAISQVSIIVPFAMGIALAYAWWPGAAQEYSASRSYSMSARENGGKRPSR